jgi:hypothetical protein
MEYKELTPELIRERIAEYFRKQAEDQYKLMFKGTIYENTNEWTYHVPDFGIGKTGFDEIKLIS